VSAHRLGGGRRRHSRDLQPRLSNLKQISEDDRKVIETVDTVLTACDRPLVITSGTVLARWLVTALLACGVLGGRVGPLGRIRSAAPGIVSRPTSDIRETAAIVNFKDGDPVDIPWSSTSKELKRSR
jgi:hypothetical protein